MAREVGEIFYEIRLQLSKKCGTEGVRVLGRAFAVNDRNNDGTVDFHTFQSVLGKAGVFLPRVDSSKLYRSHDPKREDRVNYAHFLDNLVGEINERRLNLVKLVFNTIGGGSSMTLADVMRAFNAEGHPKVQTGEYDARQVFDEFFSCLPAAQPDAASDEVTMADFTSYYTDLSAVFPHSDDAFATMMASVWGVQEPLAASRTAVAAQDREVARVRQLVADKVLQRSKAGAAETDTLRKRFKTYDLDDDGMLDQTDFFEALATLGVSLPPKQQHVFFSRVAPAGLLDYTAFAHSLFAAEEGLLPARAPAPPRKARTSTVTASAAAALPVTDPAAVLAAAAAATASDAPENNDFPAVLFLLGAPGSGTTTQSAAVAQRMGFAHVAVELLLAAAHDDNTHKLHGIVRAAASRGERVPVDAVVALIKDEMSALYAQGLRNFVIDGFPKSLEHLRAWNDIMARYCRPPCFVFLRADTRVASARATPVPSAVKDAKAETFRLHTAPLCDALLDQGKLIVLNADASEEEVTEALLDVIATA